MNAISENTVCCDSVILREGHARDDYVVAALFDSCFGHYSLLPRFARVWMFRRDYIKKLNKRGFVTYLGVHENSVIGTVRIRRRRSGCVYLDSFCTIRSHDRNSMMLREHFIRSLFRDIPGVIFPGCAEFIAASENHVNIYKQFLVKRGYCVDVIPLKTPWYSRKPGYRFRIQVI